MTTDATATPSAPTAPVRGDSILLVVPGTTGDYATADGRFYVRRRYATVVTSAGYEITDAQLDEPDAMPEFADDDLNAVRRVIAQIVDDEYRAAQLAYTAAREQAEPALAEQLADMRRNAAGHGRAMGTTGMYWVEQTGRLPGAPELMVYVSRDDYEGLLAEPAEPSIGDVVEQLRMLAGSIGEVTTALLGFAAISDDEARRILPIMTALHDGAGRARHLGLHP